MGNEMSGTEQPNIDDDSVVEARLEAFNRKLHIRRQSEAHSRFSPYLELLVADNQ